MNVFAKMFLVLFLADGGISLLDELISLLYPMAPLSEARMVLGNTVIVMALLVYLCLGIDRRLPKRVFLPLILFVFWCPLSTLLFPALARYTTYGLVMASAQVLLGLLLSRSGTGRGGSRILPPAPLAKPWFSLKHTVTFGAVNLFVIPCALVLIGFYSANAYMAEYTPGFMRLGPDGLYMTEKIYRRGNRTIRLAGMIHIGEKKYYDSLAGSNTSGRTIVLAEGVTDGGHLLTNRFDYGKVAGALGLIPQDKMLFTGRLIEPEVLDEMQLRSKVASEKEHAVQVDILRADVDVSAFRPPTILLLNAIGKNLRESSSPVRAFLSLNAWADGNITPEASEVIMEDILHLRNREVIRYMGKAIDRYDTVVIPWGALHMKEIEEEVVRRGFTMQEKRERVSLDFRNIFRKINE